MSERRTILLVDDDADDQLLFRDAIREIGFSINCAIANNGQEALRYLADNPPTPDFIFMDLNMPIMNGYECLQVLKTSEMFKDIPVVIFTTSNHPDDAEKARQLGAVMFFSKPSRFEVLQKKLGQLLDPGFSITTYAL